MKNKKLKYILIPLVIIIWGLVIYKIFSYQNNDSSDITIPENNDIINPVEFKKDTFSLDLSYNDPFLKNSRFIKQSIISNPSNIENKSKLVNQKNKNRNRQHKAKTKLTDIEFNGIVINQKTGKTTALLKIEGKNYLLNKKSTINNVTINNIFPDSIIIFDGDMERTILKK